MNIKVGNNRLELAPPPGTGATTRRLGKLAPGQLADEATTYAQVFTNDGQTFSGDNTYSGANTFSGDNTFSGAIITSGGIRNSEASMFAPIIPTAAQNNITAGTGGAVSVANYLTTINTDAGGDAFTLAAGTIKGQLKKILLVADGGGDGTLTLTGYTSIVFNDATDYVILMWNGSAWFVIENSGCTVNA